MILMVCLKGNHPSEYDVSKIPQYLRLFLKENHVELEFASLCLVSYAEERLVMVAAE